MCVSRTFGNGLLVLAALQALAPGRLSAEEGTLPDFQQVLYAVSVNGLNDADPVVLLEDARGRLYADVQILQEWQIRYRPTAYIINSGTEYFALDSLPAARLERDAQNLSVQLDVSPEAFYESSLDFTNNFLPPIADTAAGIALGYDLNAEWAGDRIRLNGFTEGSFFTSVGILTTSAVFGAGAGPDQFTRLETAWTRHNPESMTELRVGDSISAAAVGASPVRFGGIQFGRNFDTRPEFVTMPLPNFLGAATLPSSVDLLVNGARRSLGAIGPGPFELSQIPVPAGAGRVEVIVTDLVGREVRTNFDYFSSPNLLRSGLHDYSFDLGFLRQDFGTNSNEYGSAVALTTHRFGLTNGLTIEGHAQMTADLQMAGAGIVAALPEGGLLSASASASQSDEGWGSEFSAALERRGPVASFGIRGDLRTSSFDLAGIPDEFVRPDWTVSAFADLAFGPATVSANFLHRNFDDLPGENLLTANVNFPLGNVAYASVFAQRIEADTSQSSFGLNLTIPIGGRGNISSSAEMRGSRSRGQLTYQQSPPSGPGTGFNATVGFDDGWDGRVGVRQNTSFTSFTAEAAKQNGATGARLSARGSLGMIAGEPFAARELGTSFALVETEPGVRVYADNQLAGTTDRGGKLILPNLRAFESNAVRIDETDLPLNFVPQEVLQILRPAPGGGVLHFPVNAENGAFIQLNLSDGSPVPAGAILYSQGQDDRFPVVEGGEAYVTGLSTRVRNFVVTWESQSCHIPLALPKNSEVQPTIEVSCEPTILAATDTEQDESKLTLAAK